MSEKLELGKFTLIITTRCNLHCKLCCEYVPQNKPFSDMTLKDETKILDAFFDAVDYVNTLHLSGGGEPFLHKDLAEMIELAFNYNDRFDQLMVFTNSTIPISKKMLNVLIRYKDKILVHASNYGPISRYAAEIYKILQDNGINHRIIKYYGEEQDFDGWVDFGVFESHQRIPDDLANVFAKCAVTHDMHGNWRTRDGKVHWCSRSQRGMELGLIPNCPDDYVDLFDGSLSREEKQKKFRQIENTKFLLACNYCTGDQGTADETKRFSAAEQE